jgi:outer membrane protein OmpA-like peptidoglycan-associated protein
MEIEDRNKSLGDHAMAKQCHRIAGRLAVMALGCGLAFLTGSGFVFAEDQRTETQILDALKSRGPQRDLAPRSPVDDSSPSEEKLFIELLLKKPVRSITTEERRRVLELVSDKPNIDLEITFAYNSATITSQALPVLQSLGRALSNKELSGATFLIGGHTDAAGTEAYNQGLSERRADAVKGYLIENFKLPREQLLAIGFGKSRLKNPGSPLAAENRRVQIVNTE